MTREEKELIINTPITIECFDITKIPYSATKEEIDMAISVLEDKRKAILRCRNERTREVKFKQFVALLPDTYKVVEVEK